MFNYKDYYNDVVKLREKILIDMNMKRNIENIKNRKFNMLKESKKNSDDKLNSTKINHNATVSSGSNINKLPQLTISNNITSILNTSRNKDSFTTFIENHSLIKKKIHDLENYHLKRENSKFKFRLNRVSSPLRKGVLEDSYQKTRKYSELARKVKELNIAEQSEKKNIKKLRILPSLIASKIDDINKKLNL